MVDFFFLQVFGDVTWVGELSVTNYLEVSGDLRATAPATVKAGAAAFMPSCKLRR